jgi:replicative DNA helicase
MAKKQYIPSISAPAVFDENAEALVLGAAMNDKRALSELMRDLNPDYFFSPLHFAIAEAIKNLINQGRVVDPITVVDVINATGKMDVLGGIAALNRITTKAVSAAHISNHMSIIRRHWLNRKLAVMGERLKETAVTPGNDPDEAMEWLQSTCVELGSNRVIEGAVASVDLYPALLQELEARRTMKGVVGVPSGYVEIDMITGGYRPGRYYVIAGRPSMGKTTLAINIAWRAANAGKRVLFLSLEMTKMELVQKMLAMITGITGHQIDAGILSDGDVSRISKFGTRSVHSSMFIDDDAHLTPLSLRAKVFEMRLKGGVDLVVIDYIQLMSSGLANKDENADLTIVSQSIKRIAKEMDVPIIVLSQLSRKVEETGNKRPMMSHLRGSGSIEQDADLVSFVYRPAYYKLKNEYGEIFPETYSEYMIAKHRGGALADIELFMILKCSRIYGRRAQGDDHFESEVVYTGQKHDEVEF